MSPRKTTASISTVIAAKKTIETVSKEIPKKLLIGEFELELDHVLQAGTWGLGGQSVKGVSGTAWLRLDCASAVQSLELIQPVGGYRKLTSLLEVVQTVVHPETEISLKDAHLIRRDVHLGETLQVNFDVTSTRFHDLARSAIGFVEALHAQSKHGDFLVSFNDVTIELIPVQPGAGRITQGEALFPAVPPCPKEIRIKRDGFTVLLDSLSLRPEGASATATLFLPADIAALDTCRAATLALGTVSIDRDCNLYVHSPAGEYGPWLVGDTGLIIQGRGFTLDLSNLHSPAMKPPTWTGLLLGRGTASGKQNNPVDSNSGYLSGEYQYVEATITSDGFQGQLDLASRHAFQPTNPEGYVVTFEGANLIVVDSRIVSGALGPGTVRLPTVAVCKGAAGNALEVGFSALVVESNLDVWGPVSLPANTPLAWGELTNLGQEIVAWDLKSGQAGIYLPANPLASFCPDDGVGFMELHLGDLQANGVTGITAYNFQQLNAYSEDRPGATNNPLSFRNNLTGWLRIGHLGVDGEILIRPYFSGEPLGNPALSGYDGMQPFDASFVNPEKQMILAQYCASAIYDSQLDGTLKIPLPCDIPALKFNDMEFTSTARLVGGAIELPVGGVQLTYWALALVGTGDLTQAGVVSVRTGRLVFTAAGISEPEHFAEPIKLTWMEMLADGNLGELFIDYNSYGQAFDGISYSPQGLVLSSYVPGATDGYLATCGTLHFNFFGTAYVNIEDARNDAQPNAPFHGRLVRVPDMGEPGCAVTDLTLHGQVDNSAGDMLGVFDFADADMHYHDAAQDGFLGEGTAEMGFLHSDSLEAFIEVHRDATDIRLSSKSKHNLDLGYYRVGTLGSVAGCIRIEGPLVKRIAVWAGLEQSSSSGFGILEPKGGYYVEVNLDVTPTSLNFYASGDMTYSVAGSAVDIAASVHLLVDYQRASAEGEMNGRLNCNSILAGLEGSGQVTWYVDALSQYLQGRLKMSICGWTGGVGMEGGVFIGNNCPIGKAWVVKSGSEHFGFDDSILPPTLTGVYGYGYLSFGINWYIFGGGIELFAGMGAFVDAPTSPSSGKLMGWSTLPGLPYVVGTAGIYVYGEILGGLVSASAWADLDLRGPIPLYFEGTFGLEGCVLWVICASIEVTAGLNSSGFYLN